MKPNIGCDRHPEQWATRSSEERSAEVIRRLLAAGEVVKALEIARARGNESWVADDGNCEIHYPDAVDGRDAAETYVDGGDWGDNACTTWAHVYAWPRYTVLDVVVDDLKARCSHRIEIEPQEPSCISGDNHDWDSPYEIVGGIKETPGVWGHGGGVVMNECCMRCGCAKITDTWAQDRYNGEQGLTSVRYKPGQYTVSERSC
jgi:hypothetical protein